MKKLLLTFAVLLLVFGSYTRVYALDTEGTQYTSPSAIDVEEDVDDTTFGYENLLFTYTDESKSCALITGILYTQDGYLMVPSYVNDVQILGFDPIALENDDNYKKLVSVEFDHDFRFLNDYALAGLSALTKVTFNGKLVTVGNGAFAGCNRLSEVVFNKRVKSIGDDAFLSCTSLKSIELKYGLEKIGAYAFSESGLSTVSVPSSTTYIGKYAFSGCKNLKKAYTGAQVTSVKTGLFYGCKALTKVSFGANVEKIASDTLSGCSSLKKIYFYSNSFSSLKKLEIPAGSVIYTEKEYKEAFIKLLKKNASYKLNKNKIKEI